MVRTPPAAAAALLAALAALAPANPASAYTPAEGKAPMTVTLVRGDAPGCGADCPEWLALTGLIGPGTPALLSAALARLGRRDVPLLVDSPGGSVEAAEAMGRAIRARGMAVAVAGTSLDACAGGDRACAARGRAGERRGFVAGGIAACASACVLVLAAGAERSVGPNSFVGVHQIVVRRTFTRVIDTFRVLRRMVGGRPVEVGRTLVGTRPVSSRQTTEPAAAGTYSAVDRYLLGLGIAESIMPLMRATPPSGIHWMTRAEVASTRIATDTTDARTLVDRAARAGAPDAAGRAPTPGTMALAAAALGDGRGARGIATWRVAEGAGGPRLVAAVDVPERGLRGTLTLERDASPGTPGGFVASTDFGPPGAIDPGRVWTAQAPRVCAAAGCDAPFAPAPEGDAGAARRSFRAGEAAGDRLLSDLRDRGWISIPLSADDGRRGWATLSIDGDIRAVVGDWEHACCGLARPEPARPAPAEPAPVEGRAAFTLLRPGVAPPLDGTAAVVWHPPAPGRPALTGAVSVPAAGLSVALTAAPAGGADAGRVDLDLAPVARPNHFGPARSLSVPPVRREDGRAAISAERVEPFGDGGFRAVLSGAGGAPAGARLALELADGSGRRVTLALPLDGPLGALLAPAIGLRQAAGR